MQHTTMSLDIFDAIFVHENYAHTTHRFTNFKILKRIGNILMHTKILVEYKLWNVVYTSAWRKKLVPNKMDVLPKYESISDWTKLKDVLQIYWKDLKEPNSKSISSTRYFVCSTNRYYLLVFSSLLVWCTKTMHMCACVLWVYVCMYAVAGK